MLLLPISTARPAPPSRAQIAVKFEADRQRAIARWVATSGLPCCGHLPLRHGDRPVWRRRRHRPLLLVSRSVRSLLAHPQINHPHLGQLFTPRMLSGLDITEGCYVPWAADNDAFSGFNETRWLAMLDRLEYLTGGLFITIPDVVADAEATLDLFATWGPDLGGYPHPIALVAQDGLEHCRIPWARLDVLFIGGSTTWKLGQAAAGLIREAHGRGKWVHVGRCNTWRRITWFKALGVDSMDGTGFATYSRARLGMGLAACAAPTQGSLL